MTNYYTPQAGYDFVTRAAESWADKASCDSFGSVRDFDLRRPGAFVNASFAVEITAEDSDYREVLAALVYVVGIPASFFATFTEDEIVDYASKCSVLLEEVAAEAHVAYSKL